MSEQDFHPKDEPAQEQSFPEETFVVEDNTERPPKKEEHRKDPLEAITWGLILVWAGIVFLAANLGWLDQIQLSSLGIEGFTLSDISTWPLIFLGAGLLVFLEAIIRSLVPAYRFSTASTFFAAVILLGVGVGLMIGFQQVWPFILIAMGLAAIASALIAHRK